MKNVMVLQHIKALYGFDDPTFVETNGRGYSADNFVIEDKGIKYFVKRYNPKRTRERLLEVHAAEQFFLASGVPAIAPVTTLQGETLWNYEGRYFALFPYIVGKQFHTLPTAEAAASAGALLAKLHLVSQGKLSVVNGKTMDTWDKDRFLEEADTILALIKQDSSSFGKQAREFLELKIKLAQENTMSFESLKLKTDSLLHGDYHYHNLFFDEQGNVTHVFDFERVMQGARAADLAYGLFFIAFDVNNEVEDDVSDIHFSRAASYLRGYNGEFPIPTEEMLSGVRWYFWSKMVHLMWPLNIHYLDGSTRTDGLLPKRLNRLHYFVDNFDTALAKFKSYMQN